MAQFLIVIPSGTIVAQAACGIDTLEFHRLERVWNQAHLAGDTLTLDNLWDDNITIDVPQMRPMRKADALAFWRSPGMRFLDYETTEIGFRAEGKVVVVSGTLHRRRQIGKRIIDDQWRFRKTYVLNRGRWQVLRWIATPLSE